MPSWNHEISQAAIQNRPLTIPCLVRVVETGIKLASTAGHVYSRRFLFLLDTLPEIPVSLPNQSYCLTINRHRHDSDPSICRCHSLRFAGVFGEATTVAKWTLRYKRRPVSDSQNSHMHTRGLCLAVSEGSNRVSLSHLNTNTVTADLICEHIPIVAEWITVHMKGWHGI